MYPVITQTEIPSVTDQILDKWRASMLLPRKLKKARRKILKDDWWWAVKYEKALEDQASLDKLVEESGSMLGRLTPFAFAAFPFLSLEVPAFKIVLERAGYIV